MQLARIAPVTAVRGNCDVGDDFRETEVIELGGRRFVVRHEVDVRFAGEALRAQRRHPALRRVGGLGDAPHRRWGGARAV